ncbi:MAG: PhnA protein [Flavobacteriaceae bacterium]|nr:PhnA domain-containing protein [Bacteroidia bacterium]NNK83483.1 PhnA protein [Flavobacteriaceae bacterium]
MSLERLLNKRSGNSCELCGAEDHLQVYTLQPAQKPEESNSLCACKTCVKQIENPDTMDANHWRCLNDSMWSEHKPVQISAWRLLNRLKSEGWPQDLLEMMYLDEDDLKFAKALGDGEDDENKLVHRDVNGVVLKAGDSVVLIKDLKVKGSSMVAKQGTAVRRISLDQDNEEYIEGKVDGINIVIITKYVKKI